MKSGIYAACFLAAFAAATPIEHEARQISSFNQASGSGQQATSNSQATPWGMSSNQQSSSIQWYWIYVQQRLRPTHPSGSRSPTNFPGAGFNNLMMPFGQMLPTMQSFVSSYSQNSAFSSYAQTLNPFVNLIGGCVPGFGGLLRGF
ncbi:hypothetical protein KEM48_006824 [Puccinia striiformis f. sp. tritici PST-130]|nr:hypothetical protein KEM48_006824 [Puccinia striiformis f. sp. tritici PST-130]